MKQADKNIHPDQNAAETGISTQRVSLNSPLIVDQVGFQATYDVTDPALTYKCHTEI